MNVSFKSTSLEHERQQQKLWRLRPQCAGMTIFDTLLENEFLPLAEQRQQCWQSLQKLLRYCNRKIPYYKRLFKQEGLRRFDFDKPEDLQKIPLLTKSLLQEYRNELTPASLPRGEIVQWVTKTSGSTGQPVEVLHTRKSGQMFGFLKQREMRWFHWDPRLVAASIRPAKDLPPGPDGNPIELGQTSRLSAWQRVAPYFETGPFYGFQRANPIEEQKEWLAKIQPAYLIAQAADLEQLALAYQADKPLENLMGLHAVAQELTPEMRQRIEMTFRVPVHQNYGLNEVGLVAAYCPEGDRYHVHTEHCYVEIVDDDGRLCEPGQRGRILVTALNNTAMPLVRYDTDDLAEVVEGPCPCGRSLPSFGKIHGRYRRLTSLPPGTIPRFITVAKALNEMPAEFCVHLRQYQLHQHKDGNFSLRVVASNPLPDKFFASLMDSWQQVDNEAVSSLRIREVDHIPRPPGGKFQNFTSDFMPVPGS